MKHCVKPLVAIVVCLFVAEFLIAADAQKEARVTKIIKDVQVVPADGPIVPATIDELVQETSAVRTGEESRSELTFADFTITRLGANTIFSFNRAGRVAELDTGQLLVRVPKNSGGATIKARAVTVGITGTTVIFEGNTAGDAKLIVLEGGARMRLNKYPKQSKRVAAAQMLEVRADTKMLPDPVHIDLNEIMQTHPLITDFPPLPSQDLIFAAANASTSPGKRGTNKPKPVVTQPIVNQPPPSPVVGPPTGIVPPPPPGPPPPPPPTSPVTVATPTPGVRPSPKPTPTVTPTPTPRKRPRPPGGIAPKPPGGVVQATPTPPVIYKPTGKKTYRPRPRASATPTPTPAIH
jgi:hypothetical protein